MRPTNTRISLHQFFCTLIFCCCFIFNGSLSAQDDSEMKAKQLFSEQQYEEALPFFADLIRLYPDDPELNYYYGASLIETGQFNPEAEKALTLGGNTEKSQWYLAQYYHAHSEWGKALTAYTQFKDNASAKDLRSVPLDEMIDLCNRELNPFAEAGTETPKDSIVVAEMVPDSITTVDSLQQMIAPSYNFV